jgi:hypothetical protein
MERTEAEFAIPAGMLQGLVDYLGTRPWKEVNQVMPGLLSLKLVPKAQEAWDNGEMRPIEQEVA